MSAFFSRGAVINATNAAINLGMLLVTYAAVSSAMEQGEKFWIMPEDWTPPPELEGIDINEHPCALLCLEEHYRKALESLVNHPQIGQYATSILSYCANAITSTAAATCEWLQEQPSGLDACLPSMPEEEKRNFFMKLGMQVIMPFHSPS